MGAASRRLHNPSLQSIRIHENIAYAEGLGNCSFWIDGQILLAVMN